MTSNDQTFIQIYHQKIKKRLEKTIQKLTTTNYEEDFQFNVGEYDAAIAFFVKRGFFSNVRPNQLLI